MRHRTKQFPIIVIVLFLFFGGLLSANAQKTKPKLEALTEETQKSSENQDKISFVWWIPTEFWRIALAEEKSLGKEDIEAFAAGMNAYTLICVVDMKGTIGSTTKASYRTEAELRPIVKLVDVQGTTYAPIPKAQISVIASTVIETMTPMLTSAIGTMGQGMHFFLFPANAKDGTPLADVSSNGLLKIKVGTDQYQWKLPLVSLLPLKICPVDSAEMQGDWKFCPHHGEKLIGKKEK